jgi:hypothetical protein
MVSERADSGAKRLGGAVRPIVAESDGKYELVGSGVTVRFGPEVVLFTAGHVVAHDLLVGCPSGFAPLEGRALLTRPRKRRGRDVLDAAVVTFAPHRQGVIGSGYVLSASDLDVNDSSLPLVPSKHYLAIGFPEVGAEFITSEAVARFEALVLTTRSLDRQAYRRAGARELQQVVLEFDQMNTTAPDGVTTPPDLFGVSGGGLWNLGSTYQAEADDARLAAIATEWNQRKVRAIVGTRVSVFCEMLRQRRPDLSEHIPRSTRLTETIWRARSKQI